MPNFGDFQLELYIGGLAGNRPAMPMTYPPGPAPLWREPIQHTLSYSLARNLA